MNYFPLCRSDAHKTIYILAGLTLIGGKGSDFIGWEIYYYKICIHTSIQNTFLNVLGQTLFDGSTLREIPLVCLSPVLILIQR